MPLLDAILLFLAGFVSGVVNAVAGGGTFITFGAMSLAGIPPIAASATSAVTQLPGYITSTLAYWSDIKTFWRGALLLCAISAVGAVAGSMILLALDNPSFRVGPWLKPKQKSDSEEFVGSFTGSVVQLVTAIYGGFFGAGMGVMMLASLGLTQAGDYHRLNALKNMLAVVIAAIAILVFASGGVIAWGPALVMVPGGALGGYAGVWIAKRVPQSAVRAFVIATGLLLALYYFATG